MRTDPSASATERSGRSVDGKAFVEAALRETADRIAQGARVCAVFDIDDTLADSRARTLHLAGEWDRQIGTRHFERLTLSQVQHDALSTARALGLATATAMAFDEFWRVAFWDGRNFLQDAPIRPMVELAHRARRAGAEVMYLTGRVQDRELFTIEQLQRFGLAATAQSVVSKPDLQTRTVAFKSQWLLQAERDGIHVAFFITESRRDIAGIQAQGGGRTAVLLDSPFGGDEPVRPDTPIFPRCV